MIILHAEIIRLRAGPDHVYLHTDQPAVFPEEPYLTVEFTAPRGGGEAYLVRCFPDVPISRKFEGDPSVSVPFSSLLDGQ